ncbi:MAG: UDP-3-O-(3-hydroxymyristoyl)glucosamine N-acyltransferase [Acidobacteriaceae bacterium]|nr:UDP-3-O-(3-hydroxymyristoyl)glucosamine N-acyltransferase [Acidobacteriaceae bacterium]
MQAQYEGDDHDLSGAAPLETAGPSDLSFIGNRRAAATADSSRAGCLLVPHDYQPASPRTLIRVAEPRTAFARAIAILHPASRPAPGIHPTAVIAATAQIRAGVTIGPYVTISENAYIGSRSVIHSGCSIGAHSHIGDDCTLHPHVVLYDRVQVGNRVILHAGVTLGADGFGFVLTAGRYEKFPQIGTVEIGDDVEIGAQSCVDRAALGVTYVGNGTKLDNMVHVGHNCRIGNHVVIAAQTGLSGGVVIEDYAVIGGQVGIGDKARIESKAVLGSGCGILTSKIVRGGQVVWGTPARPLKQYLEQLAVMARLPKLLEDLADLRKQLADLRNRTNPVS